MRARRTGAALLSCACALAVSGWLPLAGGCTASSPAPLGARRTMAEAQRDPRGAWINIVTVQGEVAGELLAVEPQALVVASTTAGFQRVPVARIRSWSLSWYEAENEGVILWGVVGTLSTLSHGFFLVLTAPLLWMIPTPIMARAQSKQGHESGTLGDEGTARLAAFARFPAGLPPGFDPTVPAPEGRAGQRCYPNQTCDAGLSCDRGACRPASKPTAPPPPASTPPPGTPP